MHAKQKESFHRFFLEVLADALPFGEFHFHDDGVFGYEMKKIADLFFCSVIMYYLCIAIQECVVRKGALSCA